MKAMSSMQILVTIIVSCVITLGIAAIGFWQHFKIQAELKAEQTNSAVIELVN